MLVGFLWELLLENKRLICNLLKACLDLRKKKVSYPCFALWSESVGALCKCPWAEPLNPSRRRAALLLRNEDKIEIQRNLYQQFRLKSLSPKMLVFWGWVKVAWERCDMSRSVAYSSIHLITGLPLVWLPNISLNGASCSYNCLNPGRLTLY